MGAVHVEGQLIFFQGFRLNKDQDSDNKFSGAGRAEGLYLWRRLAMISPTSWYIKETRHSVRIWLKVD